MDFVRSSVQPTIVINMSVWSKKESKREKVKPSLLQAVEAYRVVSC
jgi:hypothetical protein